MTTVTRKPRPKPRATILKRFLSIAIRAEYFGDEYNSSDVIRSIMAVIASHKLMSDRESGKYMMLTLYDLVEHLYCRAVGRGFLFLDYDGFA